MLCGKNAIISGARRGIGRASVEVFAKNGANVWACARRQDDSFEADMAQLAQKYNVWIRPVYFEMTSQEEIKRAVADIRKEKLPVDILINNAGISYDAILPMLSLDKCRETLEVNFLSQLSLTQLVARLMMKAGHGSIVYTASYLGMDGNRGQTIYSASKAAVIAMTKSLSKELSDYGIRVNAVAPGVVDTDMISSIPPEEMEKLMERCLMHRAAKPEEVANLIAFLSSDLASYITGQVVRVDGGM